MTVSIRYGMRYDDGGVAERVDSVWEDSGIEELDVWIRETFNGQLRYVEGPQLGSYDYMFDFETEEEATVFLLSI